MIRSDIAFFVFTVKSFSVFAVLKNGGKEFYEHSKAVSLISAECFADSAERCKSSRAAANLLKSFACVALYGSTVDIDNRTGMNGLVDSCIVFDFTVLGNRGSAVKIEVERLV